MICTLLKFDFTFLPSLLSAKNIFKEMYAPSYSKLIPTPYLWMCRAPNLALEPDLVGVAAVRVNAAAPAAAALVVDDGDV